MTRLQHHSVIGGLSLAGLVAAALIGSPDQSIDRLSLVSAWICLMLLCAVLSIGPWQAIQTGRPWLNNYLRRDIGIWAALTGLAHFYFGTEASMNQTYQAAFVRIMAPWPDAQIRSELFSWGSIAGLIVGVLCLLLLCISNDRSLRRLGPSRWKRLHRSSYFLFGFTIVHGLAFQILESRDPALILATVGATVAILALQIAGARRVRRAASSVPE